MNDRVKTVMQIIVHLLALGNSLLAIFGDSIPVCNSRIYTIGSVLILVGLYCFGVFRSFRKKDDQKLPQKIERALKDGEFTIEELQEVLSFGSK